jgi:hypothetical protein
MKKDLPLEIALLLHAFAEVAYNLISWRARHSLSANPTAQTSLLAPDHHAQAGSVSKRKYPHPSSYQSLAHLRRFDS